MTSLAGIKRAKSHTWRELDPETEICAVCKLELPKATDLEKVPACSGITVVGRR
jgi:hypothetical protein